VSFAIELAYRGITGREIRVARRAVKNGPETAQN
jgi:hypothetical protein